MELTSRITSIEPAGTWSNGQRTFNKFRVCFANGDNLNFLAVDKFKYAVGENVTYIKNAEQNTGKIKRDFIPREVTKEVSRDKVDTQTYIIRQSSLKSAIDYHASNPAKTESQVIETARNFVNFVNNG